MKEPELAKLRRLVETAPAQRRILEAQAKSARRLLTRGFVVAIPALPLAAFLLDQGRNREDLRASTASAFMIAGGLLALVGGAAFFLALASLGKARRSSSALRAFEHDVADAARAIGEIENRGREPRG